MTRWLVVVILAVTQDAAVAAASPGSLDGRARPGEVVMRLMRSAEQVNEPHAQAPQAQEPQAQEPQAQEPQAQAQQVPAPPKPAGAGCIAGRRVIAATYGRGQRTTSSGERFDPRGMTAAHRTLPFGTRLTVTNPKTGKSVVVVVNDRGPFARRLDIDLSIAAARTIGLDGVAAVCIE
jgi:rare lipoprotein A